MNAIKKLIARCNEMDITEQLNWLGDASMSYQAKLELAALTTLLKEIEWSATDTPPVQVAVTMNLKHTP